MLTVVVATRNEHKLAEIRAILGEGFRWMTLRDFPGAPSVVEDASTFAGNAVKKAEEVACWLSAQHLVTDGGYVLADDSGLEVDCLGGAPGVHSARFASIPSVTDGVSVPSSEGLPSAVTNSPDRANNEKLLRLLSDRNRAERTARFRCVIAVTPILPNTGTNSANPFEAETKLFEGACEGMIGTAPRGAGGFGYDPLFTPQGFQETFAELGEDVKNRISHRAKALERLRGVFHP